MQMARISIYVRDELKARMDSVGEAANWSEVVRPAILLELAYRDHRTEMNMTTGIDRLRASKEEEAQKTAIHGHTAGERWALNKASHSELRRVAQIAGDRQVSVGMDLLYQVIDPNGEMQAQEFYDVIGYDDFHDRDVFAELFAEAAAEIFDQV